MTNHSGGHPDRELLERFMRNDLDSAGRRLVVRHLLAGCAQCVAVTSQLWALGDPSAQSPRRRQVTARQFPSPPLPGNAATYVGVFDRLAGASGADERRIAEEEEEAPGLVAELLSRVPAARLPLVCVDPRFRTPAVCELLLARCLAADQAASLPLSASASPPADSGSAPPVRLQLEIAEVALTIAERLDVEICGAATVSMLETRSWAHLAEARRLEGDREGAARALAMAELVRLEGMREHWDGGSRGSMAAAGEPLEQEAEMELLAFKASLWADQGRLQGAERLLARALALQRPGALGPLIMRLSSQRAALLARLGQRAAAIDLLGAAVGLLPPPPASVAPLVLAGLEQLAGLLHEEGRLEEALAAVSRARPLAEGVDPAREARLRLLAGRIEAAAGRLDAAEVTLRDAAGRLARLDCGREAALAWLEVAILQVRQGRSLVVREIASGLHPLLGARDLRRDGFLLLLFQRQAEREPADLSFLGEMASYFSSPAGQAVRPRPAVWPGSQG
ncbi:MAG TPA: hypothetical protein VHR45_16885 [Thermoanaerobaculia bacterium]|nr:hypothetical protein [Thermoanaerobaculia bacterium]